MFRFGLIFVACSCSHASFAIVHPSVDAALGVQDLLSPTLCNAPSSGVRSPRRALAEYLRVAPPNPPWFAGLVANTVAVVHGSALPTNEKTRRFAGLWSLCKLEALCAPILHANYFSFPLFLE